MPWKRPAARAEAVADVEPDPVRVEVVDVEDPPLSLAADGRHLSCWLVVREKGVPQAIVEIDLPEHGAVDVPLDRLRAIGTVCRPLDEVRDDELPGISIVIPTIAARTEELDRCLTTLGALHYPDFEVVVVDNRREVPDPDPLQAMLDDRPYARTVRAPRPGISAARNAGLAAAKHDIVAFTDDDVHVDPYWLRAIGRRFVSQPSLDAVTGLILPAELETPAQVYFERYYGGFSGERTFTRVSLAARRGLTGRADVVVRGEDGQVVRDFVIYGVGAYGAGANMTFRRGALERLGGFDLTLGTGTPARGGEDLAALIGVLWSGGEVGGEPAAVVHHRHRREYPELLHQMRGNGTGFVAMLTSLMVQDPRHLLTLTVRLPLALRRFFLQTVARLKDRVARTPAVADHESAVAIYPLEMVRHEMVGMLKGLPAYLRSRRAGRRWQGSQHA